MTKARTVLCALGIASLTFAPIAAPAEQTGTSAWDDVAVTQPEQDQRADRSFHPDYTNALTPSQMSAAWQVEIDRLFPPAFAGGG
jgi:hypothetical protein